MGILVTNIQRMCMQDGPGIRTTVFLKGCPLHCPWCCNPENIRFDKQFYFIEEICTVNRGTSNLCDHCPAADVLTMSYPGQSPCCPFGAIGVYGKEYDAQELVRILLKDRLYWEGGGVTFSGGEALMQARELLPAMRLLKEKDIHIAVETSLYVQTGLLEAVIDYVDLFLIDVKILDKERSKSILGGDVDLLFQSVRKAAGAGKEIVFRIPCCDEFTLTDENLNLLDDFFQDYKGYSVELFRVHTLGMSKHKSLGCLPVSEYPACEKKMKKLMSIIENTGNHTEIIKL